jgi:hypothetical protein
VIADASADPKIFTHLNQKKKIDSQGVLILELWPMCVETKMLVSMVFFLNNIQLRLDSRMLARVSLYKNDS